MGWTQVGTIGGSATAGGGGGGSGSPGPPGRAGTQMLLGSTPPTIQLGNVGDLFFLAPPPGEGQPVLIPGPPGPPGAPGAPGAAGSGGGAAYYGGDGAAFTPTTVATWTKVDMRNGSTFQQASNGVSISAVANNGNIYSFVAKPIPAATPYSCIFYIKPLNFSYNYQGYGPIWYDSINNYGKFLNILINTTLQTHVGYGKSGTMLVDADYSGENFALLAPVHWFKLRDDGTNQTYSISADGTTWIQLYTQARNTDVTPNMVGFGVDPLNTSQGMTATLMSYQETN